MTGTILWFKRDLRVADHPALARAAAIGAPVLPLYIVEPGLWAQADADARHYGFLRESLVDLRGQLDRIGLRLVIRLGEAVPVLEALRAAHGLSHLVSHEETGNGWTYARDRAVAAWARGQGVVWEEVPQSGVVRRLRGRDGWAAGRDAFMAAPVMVPAPVAMLDGVASDALPGAARLGLGADAPQRQRGGRAEGLAALQSFLTERGRDYRRAMSSPSEGARACSRLSPHLAFGTVSVREADQAAAQRAAQVRGAGDGWAGSVQSFRSRLAWRDHFMQKLEDEPALEYRCLHPAYEGLRPSIPDAARLAAWQKGETGLPFVDACMRSLAATGWLNFRMRSMVMAVASYHLWLDWRATGAHLARMFTDYEPGIHWSQVQMQSGTTGINTLRIYNPVKQGMDQDPTGAFTRAWVPELAAVPDVLLQEPWRWDGAGGLPYPAPIVDVKQAAAWARDRVWAVRQGDGFRAQAAQVVRKHASRKDARGRFRRDPVALKRDTGQMGFDF
ncbi:MAG: deoxyribodipyrimidine photo-lyase [Rhodobacterales bacterium]|nr:deoxyribodipyrimidine photo-lyase [Rhodobacterales bacterium]MDX5411974.1 deoxyribodipyrimidine photo-lyase [Rhodobacterales bacterium]